MWTRHLLLTFCAFALSGCGLFDAFSGARTPEGTAPDEREELRPPLVVGAGGVSEGEEHQLFLRPTAAAPGAPTLTGSRYRLSGIDARPQGGDAR